MHDCSIATGDAWLSQQIPAILSSAAFTTQNSLLLLTWDEDDSSGNNNVDLVVAGPAAARGRLSSVATNHYSILSTLEAAWFIQALNANDSSATPLTALLTAPVSTTRCTGASVAATPPSPQMAATQVVFTALATGCPHPLYEFWARWVGHADWQLLRSYSTSTTYSWNSTGAASGIEYVGVWVKDSSSPVQADFYTSIPYWVAASSCASTSISGSPAPPQVSGTHITFPAVASGCSHANPLYQFVMRPASRSSWQIVQPYTTNAAYSWNSLGAASGTVYFGVWAKDSGSAAAYDAVASTAFAVNPASCGSASISATPTSVAGGSGTQVTITAAASGCHDANPLYQFWIRPAASSMWQLAQAYGTSNTYHWNTAGALPGTVYLGVHVRDANSTSAFDVVTSTAITVS